MNPYEQMQKQIDNERLARLNATLGQLDAQRQADGIGLSEREYDQETQALRNEAQRLKNAPIRTTSEANAMGKRIAELENAANRRDIEKPLYMNSFAEIDRQRQRAKDLNQLEADSAFMNKLRAEREALIAAYDAVVGRSRSFVGGITQEQKREAVRRLSEGDGVKTDANGQFVTFKGGVGDITVRASVVGDHVVFSAGE